MISRRTSSIPKGDSFSPRLLYSDSRCFQAWQPVLPVLSPVHPGDFRSTWRPQCRPNQLWDLTTLGFWSDYSQTLPEAASDIITFCWCISSIIPLLLSLWQVFSKQTLSWVTPLPSDLDSRTLALCIQSLNMHRWIIMSHTLVTKIKKNLADSEIGTQVVFHRDLSSKISVEPTLLRMMQDPSPCVRPNLISMWWLSGEAMCRGKSWEIQQASVSA